MGRMRRVTREMAELPFDPEHEVQTGFEGDPKVFASNLDRLTRMKGFTRKKMAEEIGANEQWLRRIITKGLIRIQREQRPYLERMAELFEIEVVEFWNPDLIVFTVNRNTPLVVGSAEEQAWFRTNVFPHAMKLSRLFRTGTHEFLKDLIDRLHGALPAGTGE